MAAVRNTGTGCVGRNRVLCYIKTGYTFTNKCCILKNSMGKILALENEDQTTTCIKEHVRVTFATVTKILNKN